MREQQAAGMCFLGALCCSPAVLLLPAPVLLQGAKGHQEQQPVVVSWLWQLAVPHEGGRSPCPAAGEAFPAMDWGCCCGLGGHSCILGACVGVRNVSMFSLHVHPVVCFAQVAEPYWFPKYSRVLGVFSLLHKHGQCGRRVCRSTARSAPAIHGPSVGSSESSPGNVGMSKQRWTHWHFLNGREC